MKKTNDIQPRSGPLAVHREQPALNINRACCMTPPSQHASPGSAQLSSLDHVAGAEAEEGGQQRSMIYRTTLTHTHTHTAATGCDFAAVCLQRPGRVYI